MTTTGSTTTSGNMRGHAERHYRRWCPPRNGERPAMSYWSPRRHTRMPATRLRCSTADYQGRCDARGNRIGRAERPARHVRGSMGAHRLSPHAQARRRAPLPRMLCMSTDHVPHLAHLNVTDVTFGDGGSPRRSSSSRRTWSEWEGGTSRSTRRLAAGSATNCIRHRTGRDRSD